MFGQIQLRLGASGVAAVLCCWMICFTALAIADGPRFTGYAMGAMLFIGVVLARALTQAQQPPDQ